MLYALCVPRMKESLGAILSFYQRGRQRWQYQNTRLQDVAPKCVDGTSKKEAPVRERKKKEKFNQEAKRLPKRTTHPISQSIHAV